MTRAISDSLTPLDHVLLRLLNQTLSAVRLLSGLLLGLSLLLLLLPATRGAPALLLISMVGLELAVVELSRWLARRGQLRQATICYVIVTQLLIAAVGLVLHVPAFFGAASALMVVLAALLVGPRHALPPGLMAIGLYALITVAERGGWLVRLEIDETSALVVVAQVVFVAFALIAVMVLSALVGERLRASMREAETRALEAERAQRGQAELNERLAVQVAEQRRLLDMIQELEVPLVPVLPGIVVLPLVSHLESRRMEAIEHQLLQYAVESRTELVLVDITGVPFVDTAGAAWIMRLGRELRLLGTDIALTGLKPATAQALVQLAVDFGTLRTYATIEAALVESGVTQA